MMNLKFWKKEKDVITGSLPEPEQVMEEIPTVQPVVQASFGKAVYQQPGSRIGAVMDRMYRLVLSVDLQLDSCYVECGNLNFGIFQIPRKGTYSKFLEEAEALLPNREKEHLRRFLGKNRLDDLFREGKSFRSELFTINGKPFEIRVERIPEIDSNSKRLRCCIFVRQVLSLEDNGISPDMMDGSMVQAQATESDVATAAIFVGSYEMSIEQNLIIGYEKRDGTFVKTDERCALKSTIESWIKTGIIAEESARIYRDYAKPGYLKKKTVGGHLTAEVLLTKPGSLRGRWYEEMVFKVGDNFRVFRRDINATKLAKEASLKEEETKRFDNYNHNVLKTMAGLVEYRNVESGPHIENVNEITRILLEDLMNHRPEYRLDMNRVNNYTEASTMHDIGKITISDTILNKRGNLLPEEQEAMRGHTWNGAKIIERISSEGHESLNQCCRDIVLHHHERYDGNGYPEGLKGDDISIGAQVVGLADAFDALCSKRAYKPAYPCGKAYEMLSNGECGAFNPKVLESLQRCYEKICCIYDRDITSVQSVADETSISDGDNKEKSDGEQ